MAKAATPTAAKSLVKREPVLFISVGVSALSTALYLGGLVGLKIPDKALKVITLGLQLAGGIGARQLVKPA